MPRFALIFCLLAAGLPRFCPAAPAPGALHDIHQIVQLPRDVASQSLPIVLHGVVTYADPVNRDFFIQQGEDAISMWYPNPSLPLTRGDLIEVRGVTAAGKFAPTIVPDPASVRVIGRAPLPPSPRVRAVEVAAGTHDCRFLSIEGVLRAVGRVRGQTEVSLQTEHGRVRILFPAATSPAVDELLPLLGAFVSARGAFATDLNPLGQQIALRVYAQEREDLQVIAPPLPAQRLPHLTLDRLSTYLPSHPGSFGRVRTEGVVTSNRSDRLFSIQDDTGAVFLTLSRPEPLEVGDRIEILGFTAVQGGGISLTDVILLGRTGGTAPEARPLPDAAALARPQNNCRLVAVTGEVRDVSRLDNELRYLLRDRADRGFVEVRVPAEAAGGRVRPLEPGDTVRVSGIKELLLPGPAETHWPALRVRTGNDLMLIQAAPFWNRTRLLLALASLAGLFLVTLAWSRWRHRQQLKIQLELERRVAERTFALETSNQRLHQLADNRARFLALSTHDLSNPLTSLIGGLGMIAHESDRLTPESAELVRALLTSARMMGDLLGNFLEFERLENLMLAPKLTPVDLAPVIQLAQNGLQAALLQKQQRLHLQLPKDPVHVLANPNLLGHALSNLLSNASKFSPPRNEITLALDCDGTSARLTVTDRGPGLHPEEIERLFQPFSRLRNRPTSGETSTGLGLYLVKGLMDSMQGGIGCESTPGQGSSFWISLAQVQAPRFPKPVLKPVL